MSVRNTERKSGNQEMIIVFLAWWGDIILTFLNRTIKISLLLKGNESNNQLEITCPKS